MRPHDAATGADEEVSHERGCPEPGSVAVSARWAARAGVFEAKPVTAEFGRSRVELTLILSTAAPSNLIVTPVAGHLAVRFGVPRIADVETAPSCGSYAALTIADAYGGFVAMEAPP